MEVIKRVHNANHFSVYSEKHQLSPYRVKSLLMEVMRVRSPYVGLDTASVFR